MYFLAKIFHTNNKKIGSTHITLCDMCDAIFISCLNAQFERN